MILMFTGLVLATIGELLLQWRPVWKSRRIFVIPLTSLLAFGTGMIWASWPNLFTSLLMLATCYRLFNYARFIEHRMHEEYLRRATWRTSWKLITLQAGILGAWGLWPHLNLADKYLWLALVITQLAVAGVLLAATVRRLRRTDWPKHTSHFSDQELPTVTVAIPARNETEDLQACLASVVASDYPKLEILVLDDCSQTKRTPEIIRGFAHAGVRFIQGKPPRDTWLPKNQAYDRLLEEANGTYVLFCGVDVRMAPDSIRRLATFMLTRNKAMVSVLPLRRADAAGRFSVIQAMRYWWELVPPRRLFNRPPVLSSCWLITRQALEKAGGFKAVARMITPEAHFAKYLLPADQYSFMRSNAVLGIESAKHPREQRATAIRMRYPQAHRRPEQVLMLLIAEMAFLILPFIVALGGVLFSASLDVQLIAGLASMLLTGSYALAARSSRINTRWFSLIALPVVAVTDLAIMHYSMWKYEFSTVDWKGRNICIPVMHTISRLPKI